MVKLVCGIGINDSEYKVQVKKELPSINGARKHKEVWICPFYKKWKSMLVRCYSDKYQERRPTYKGCSVCEEWLTFSNFKAWMEQQDWQGKELDKDVLFDGNKLYSPETCVFIDHKTNKFLNDHANSRGNLPIGVCLYRGKYMAQVSVKGKQKILGIFDTPDDAHGAWKKAKNELAIELAKEQTDYRVATALLSKYKDNE